MSLNIDMNINSNLNSNLEIKSTIKKEYKFKDCDICASEKIETAFIPCKCNISACNDCVKKFLLSDKDITPKCMNCKLSWTFDLIRESLGRDFDNKYREYRCKIIMERERSLLPQSQEIVSKNNKIKSLEETIKKVNKLLLKLKVKKNKINEQVSSLKDIYSITIDKNNKKDIKQNINEKKEETKKIKDQVNDLLKIKFQIWKKKGDLRGQKDNQEKKQIGFQGHCPQDDCRGYLDVEGLCGICEKKACKKCKQKEHQDDCNKDILETIKMLAKDTKNCPSCNIPISKISGCDQMYCVSCHTAFSWDTGKIETGRIHNPHYYQYMRNNNLQVREAGDVRCGGPINFNAIYLIFDNINKKNHPDFEYDKILGIFENSYRFSGHIRDHLLVNIYNYNNGGLDNGDLRIRYLSEKDFNETKWLFNLKKREKAREKKNVLHGIYRMFADIVDELHANTLERVKTIYKPDRSKNLIQNIRQQPELILTELVDISKQIENLRIHTNSLLEKVETQFKNKIYYITENY